jgi:hypothetical protein
VLQQLLDRPGVHDAPAELTRSQPSSAKSPTKAASSSIGSAVSAAMSRPPTVTASTLGFSRAPRHAVQGTSRTEPPKRVGESASG